MTLLSCTFFHSSSWKSLCLWISFLTHYLSSSKESNIHTRALLTDYTITTDYRSLSADIQWNACSDLSLLLWSYSSHRLSAGVGVSVESVVVMMGIRTGSSLCSIFHHQRTYNSTATYRIFSICPITLKILINQFPAEYLRYSTYLKWVE